jgi:hypothetical protein
VEEMIPKGIENADAIIEFCRQSVAGLGSAEPESKEVLQSIIHAMDELKTKFFLKTNLAIPITNACLKSAAELQSMVEKKDLSRFPEAIAELRGNTEKLLKQASMEGITIT